MVLLHLNFCGFGIGFGIGRKYWPIRVSVSVSDLNQNSGFGRSLGDEPLSPDEVMPKDTDSILAMTWLVVSWSLKT